jgi:hypothetical protein
MEKLSIETVCERWRGPNRPEFAKTALIRGYGNGFPVCRCAQGDVLHLAGVSDHTLAVMTNFDADIDVANILGISVGHSILLRTINDLYDGCPEDVLEHPERFLGSYTSQVLGFWKHLDDMRSNKSTQIVITENEYSFSFATFFRHDYDTLMLRHYADLATRITNQIIMVLVEKSYWYCDPRAARGAIFEIYSQGWVEQFPILGRFGFTTPGDIPL